MMFVVKLTFTALMCVAITQAMSIFNVTKGSVKTLKRFKSSIKNLQKTKYTEEGSTWTWSNYEQLQTTVVAISEYTRRMLNKHGLQLKGIDTNRYGLLSQLGNDSTSSQNTIEWNKFIQTHRYTTMKDWSTGQKGDIFDQMFNIHQCTIKMQEKIRQLKLYKLYRGTLTWGRSEEYKHITKGKQIIRKAKTFQDSRKEGTLKKFETFARTQINAILTQHMLEIERCVTLLKASEEREKQRKADEKNKKKQRNADEKKRKKHAKTQRKKTGSKRPSKELIRCLARQFNAPTHGKFI